MNPDRRQFLGLSCAFFAMPLGPSNSRVPAPRFTCPHTLCRNHRPGDTAPGCCGLALRAPALTEEP